MPTVEFDTREFLQLVGKQLKPDELEYKAAMLGTDPDAVDENKMVIEVFPNRPDLLSVEGFARAFRDFIGAGSGYKEYEAAEPTTRIDVDKSVEAVRPFITGAIIRDITIDEAALVSIMQMQEMLHTSHGRKRAKVAIGVHDLDKTTPPYIYTTKKPTELTFIPLDYDKEMHLKDVLAEHPKGEKYRHILEGAPALPVVLDAEGVVSLPPIINAERTKVTTETHNIFIEMTGTNKPAVEHALNILVTALADRGGKIEGIAVGDERKPALEPTPMALSINYVNQLLGIDLEAENIMELLGKMGYGVKKAGANSIDVLVPPYRADVLHPIDVVEDLAIAYGYENFTAKPTSIVTTGSEDKLEAFSSDIRRLVLGLGFQETVSFVLTNEEQIGSVGANGGKAVRIKNPRTEEFTVIRPTLLSSLLGTFAYNKKKKIPIKVFELDDVVLSKKDHQNRRTLSLGILDQEVNFSQMQSTVEALMRSIGVDFKIREDKKPAYIPGRCAQVLLGREKVGVFGEVHPEVLEKSKLEFPVVAAEIDIQKVFLAREKA